MMMIKSYLQAWAVSITLGCCREGKAERSKLTLSQAKESV